MNTKIFIVFLLVAYCYATVPISFSEFALMDTDYNGEITHDQFIQAMYAALDEGVEII